MDAKVSQFVAITGASREVAMRLLEACGNNLDLAINMHLESGGSPVPAVAGPSSEASSGTADSVLSPKSYEELYDCVCVYVCECVCVCVYSSIPPTFLPRIFV